MNDNSRSSSIASERETASTTPAQQQIRLQYELLRFFATRRVTCRQPHDKDVVSTFRLGLNYLLVDCNSEFRKCGFNPDGIALTVRYRRQIARPLKQGEIRKKSILRQKGHRP